MNQVLLTHSSIISTMGFSPAIFHSFGLFFLPILTGSHIITLPGSPIVQQELCLLVGQILSISENPPLKEYILKAIDSPIAPLAVSVLLSLSVEGISLSCLLNTLSFLR